MEIINQAIEKITNIPMEKWINLGIAIFIMLFFKLCSSKLSYIIIRIFKHKVKDKKEIRMHAFYKPLKTFFFLVGIYIGILFLQLKPEYMLIVNKAFKIICIVLAANGLANMVKPESTILKKIQEKLKNKNNQTMLGFICKILKTLIYIIAGFLIITELGYNLNGLVAGLGIGSVVLTLAAQDTAKNIFGGIAILWDKPFTVGDWISAPNCEGTVEDITFRSTRVRTIDNAVVNIPNSIISNESIINSSKIQMRRFMTQITLPLTISLESLQQVQNKVVFMMQHYEGVVENTANVKFDKITEKGYNLLIFCYFDTVDYGVFLQMQEKINYEIMTILIQEHAMPAYPTSTVYIKQEEDGRTLDSN